MPNPRDYARLRKHRFVSSSSKFVCVGESFGSYNYELRDEIYPPDQQFIPVENAFGGIDYEPNENYRPEDKKGRK